MAGARISASPGAKCRVESETAKASEWCRLRHGGFISIRFFFEGKMCRFGVVLAKLGKQKMLFFTFLPVFVYTVSSSRKTGHYTVQQSQNTHGDRHGAPTTTTNSSDSTKPSGSEPLSVPKTSGGSYPRSRHSPSPKTGSSPRHSPNFRSRLLPSCQRYNSQVGGGNHDRATPDNTHSCL